MKMKRILALVMALTMILVSFTGCMYGEDRLVINEDGSGTAVSRIVFDKAVCDQVMESMGMTMADMGIENAKVETVDGVESYVVEETTDFATLAEMKEGLEASGYSDIYASKSGLRYVLNTGVDQEQVKAMEDMGFDLGDSLSAKVIITMPKEILATTGTLSEDKKTAEFYFEGNAFYQPLDIMVSTAKETTKPTVSGATNKKTYNSVRTITVKDASGIKSAQYKKGANGKKYSFELSKTFNKNGTYTVYATDYYGNKTTRTFTIKDTKKPTVSGVTNKKTYSTVRTLTFSDNCGVKSVKLYRNGKKQTVSADDIAFGIEIEKAGSYKVIVTDVNGLSRTVTFTKK